MVVNINGIDYEISEGEVFSDTYNEELDSATIIVPQLDSELDIQPLDVVLINNKYMCIQSFSCQEICLTPKKYTYTITLMSRIKAFEGISLPNLRITRNIDNPKSIKYYLQQYLDEYSPKIKISDKTYTNMYTLSTAVINRFDNIICPEMQWNQPTLREVFNDLMMVDDCIVTLNNTQVEFIDISVNKSEATADQKAFINFAVTSRSVEDYVSELKMDLVNGFDSNRRVLSEQLRFRNSNVYVLSTANMRLETRYPIWKINSLKCSVITKNALTEVDAIDSQNNHYPIVVPAGTRLEIDLTPYILEYQEWLTKDIYYSGFTWSTQRLNANYQNTCLFYNRGGNLITNFDNSQTTMSLFIKNTDTVYELIINSPLFKEKIIEISEELMPGYDDYEVLSYDPTLNPADFVGEGNFNFLDFDIEYETMDECSFRVSKMPGNRNTRVIIDNQTNSYVNIEKQGVLEYLKANRLGNELKVYNARYPDTAFIIDVGHTIDSRVIFKREISIYKNYINVNYYTTENYILQDYFTGVRARIRSWKVVDGSEASLRKDILKFYINEDTETDDYISINGESYYYKVPYYFTIDGLLNDCNYCVIKFKLPDNTYQPKNIQYVNNNSYGVNMYQCEFTKHKIGESGLLTIKMNDNTVLGKYIYNYLDSASVLKPSDYQGNFIGGTLQKDALYTDSNGEFIGGEIWFYKTKNNLSENEIFLKPAVNTTNLFGLQSAVMVIPFKIHKDNAEITQLSIQLEWNPDANDIFIGKIF